MTGVDAQPKEETMTGDVGKRLPLIVYFSSVSGYTHRFVGKLGARAARIPLTAREEPLLVDEPFVLITPTYGGGKVSATGRLSAHAGGGYVPKQVIRFLNNPDNRAHITGVIAGGNTNFGEEYGLAGAVVSQKCQVPFLYRFELMGTPEDVERVQAGLARFAREKALV